MEVCPLHMCVFVCLYMNNICMGVYNYIYMYIFTFISLDVYVHIYMHVCFSCY